MTATVEQTRSELSRLIDLAAQGEEIVITEEGRPVAKLLGIQPLRADNGDKKLWLEQLRELRGKTSTGKAGKSGDEIISEGRAERDL